MTQDKTALEALAELTEDAKNAIMLEYPSDHPYHVKKRNYAFDLIKTNYDLIREALESKSLPEGWKLVPIEPTNEMCKAAYEYYWEDKGIYEMIKEAIATAPTYGETE